jgi:hypothetical protein
VTKLLTFVEHKTPAACEIHRLRPSSSRESEPGLQV